MNDLIIAYIMSLDERNVTYEEGVDMAEAFCDDLMWAVEERKSYAEREEDG